MSAHGSKKVVRLGKIGEINLSARFLYIWGCRKAWWSGQGMEVRLYFLCVPYLNRTQWGEVVGDDANQRERLNNVRTVEFESCRKIVDLDHRRIVEKIEPVVKNAEVCAHFLCFGSLNGARLGVLLGDSDQWQCVKNSL